MLSSAMPYICYMPHVICHMPYAIYAICRRLLDDGHGESNDDVDLLQWWWRRLPPKLKLWFLFFTFDFNLKLEASPLAAVFPHRRHSPCLLVIKIRLIVDVFDTFQSFWLLGTVALLCRNLWPQAADKSIAVSVFAEFNKSKNNLMMRRAGLYNKMSLCTFAFLCLLLASPDCPQSINHKRYYLKD